MPLEVRLVIGTDDIDEAFAQAHRITVEMTADDGPEPLELTLAGGSTIKQGVLLELNSTSGFTLVLRCFDEENYEFWRKSVRIEQPLAFRSGPRGRASKLRD